MDTKTNHPDGDRAVLETAGSPGTVTRPRSKRALGIVLAALMGIFSLGLAVPAATAAETSTEAQYELEIDGQVIVLAEGETAVFGMQRIESPTAPGQVAPNAVYPGNAGVLTVTGSGGSFHYSIAMSIPATSFSGVFNVTDISSGLSGGATAVSGFSGSVPTSRLRGHQYSGVLTGTAYLLGLPVATTVPNYTLYTYTG